MAIIVERTDTFEQWRVKTNQISANLDVSTTDLQSQINANVVTLNNNIASNVVTLNNNIASNVGNVQELVTIVKSNAVAAINETYNFATNNRSNIGILSNLVTTSKANLVAAINETQTSANITGGKAIFTNNVGIGTSNPTAPLHVVGNIITGNITVSGSITGALLPTESEVGSYAFCYINNGASAVTFGMSVYGYNLDPAGVYGAVLYTDTGTSLAGTWRCLGYIGYYEGTGDYRGVTMFQRIA